jgi:hypothetical protein
LGNNKSYALCHHYVSKVIFPLLYIGQHEFGNNLKIQL